MAEALHGLARLYRELGKYEEAEPLYQRALVIRELDRIEEAATVEVQMQAAEFSSL